MSSRSIFLLASTLLACHAGSSNPDKPLSDPLVVEVAEASAPLAIPSAVSPAPPAIPSAVSSEPKWAERRARVVPMPLATLLASANHSAACSELSARLAARPAQSLSPAEGTLALVARLEGVVQSGGFEHFFADETGNDALATADALKAVGATGAIPIFANALSHFPSATPATERKARQVRIGAMPHGLREFDVETLAFHDPAVTAETCDQMLVYARAHVKELKLPPAKPAQDASADGSR